MENKLDSSTRWWTAGGATGTVAAYQGKNSTSDPNSLINLANPGTYNLTKNGTPAWSASTGWTGAGNSANYLKTGVVPSGNQAWTYVIGVGNFSTFGNAWAFGTLDTSGTYAAQLLRYIGNGMNYANSTSINVMPLDTSGTFAIAGKNTYRNGVSDGTLATDTSRTYTGDLWLLARNNNGTAQNSDGSTITAFAVYNTTLSAGQIAAITTSMNNFPTSNVYTEPGATFTTVPTTIYFGTKQDGTSQADATYSNFSTLTPTLNTTAPFMKFGNNSAKLVNGGTIGDEYTVTMNVGSASTYGISAYVYDGTTGNIGGTVSNTIAELWYNNNAVTTTYTEMGSGWWRLTGTLTGVSQNAQYGVQVKGGKTIYIDGIQLELRAGVTSYIDGSLGTGYSWSGTANNSNSVRVGMADTTPMLSYATSGNMSASAGTISLWYKPVLYTTGSTAFQVGYGGGWGPGFKINYTGSSISADCFVACGGPSVAASQTLGKWANVVLTWGGGQGTAYFNGVGGSTVAFNPTNLSSIMTFGGTQGWAGMNPGMYSDLRIFNQALTSAQVTSLYTQGLGMYSQASTNQQKYSATGTWESPVINLNSNAAWGISPNFVATETLNGNTTSYEVRTSPDGNTWSSYSANTGSSPNYSISSGAQKYIQVKANLNSATQLTTPTVSGLSIHYVQDTTAPITNGLNTTMKNTLNGRDIVETTGWANDPSPYFGWDLGVDNVGGSGIKGYCLSLSQTLSDNPASVKGLLGTSPVSTIGYTCQFIVGTNEIDFSDANLRGNTWLSTSNSPYYLNIKAIDNTGNIFPTSETFEFLYDDIPPTNVTSFSAPQNSFSNVDDIYFNWPVSGAGIASDTNSLLLGYQYSINNETDWTGSDLNTTLSVNYIPVNHAQPFYLTITNDSSHIQMGNNTIYFRALDIAGNRSSISRTALISYGGDAPNFPDGSSITITPEISTNNMFSVSWPNVVAAPGRTLKSYYYMINTTPPNILSTILSNSSIYIPTTSTSIPLGKLVGAVKGQNTISVVAIDDVNNYSGSNSLTKTFTLDSTLPDPALNLRAADTSIKSVSLWSVSLAWNEPAYKGTGALTYQVDRSEDGINWVKVSETNGTAFVDTVPSSRKYYYRVGSMDNTDESKANPSFSLSVSITPKGSYTVPAPLVSNPISTNITTRRATVSWVTGRLADSKVAYGTEPGKYFVDEIANSKQVTEHINNLTSLLPSTTYYYKVSWTDEDGNVGQSDEQTFVTNPAPVVKDVTVRYVNTSSAQIQFTSKEASKVKIYYGKSTQFGSLQELPTSTNESKYTAILDGLTDGTKYYYRINPYDLEDTEYEGTVLDFKTLPSPKVSDVKLQQIKNTAETSILINWKSNTEVSSIVTYYPEGKIEQSRDNINLTLIGGDHKATLTGLLSDQAYSLVVRGLDRVGNEAKSDIVKFTTASDTRPPVISEVSVEAAPSDIADAVTSKKSTQIIVSWKTDEPATTRVEYGENTGDVYNYKTPDDTNLKTDHVVIISNLSASQIYHLRAISIDKASNESKSIDMVSITPNPNDNAFDLILKNFRNIFSF